MVMDDDDYDDEEFCADCLNAYNFRILDGGRVNSCDVYPESRGYWFSDLERPGCGRYERRTPTIKYKIYNQLKHYNPM